MQDRGQTVPHGIIRCQLHPTLYLSAEEGLDSATLRGRLARTLSRAERTLLIEGLPRTVQEWIPVLFTPEGKREAVVVDSLTALGVRPSDVIEGEFSLEAGVWVKEIRRWMLRSGSWIWIAQADKEGRAYRGEACWAHEADAVVRCAEGFATTTKNRFGPAGRTFSIHQADL
jgi:hypothetical protein